MNWLDFIASMFGSLVKLAWPAAVFGSVWVFRNRIEALLPNLKLKYRDFDVSFRLEEAEKDAALLPHIEDPIPPTPEEKSRFHRIAEISPRAAILDTRVELESFLAKTVDNIVSNSVEGSSRTVRPMSMMSAIRFLRAENHIDENTSRLLDELRSFGNVASHEADALITTEDAIRYNNLAERLKNQLLSLRWFEKPKD